MLQITVTSTIMAGEALASAVGGIILITLSPIWGIPRRGCR